MLIPHPSSIIHMAHSLEDATAALLSTAPPTPEAGIFGVVFLGFAACSGLALGLVLLLLFWGRSQWRTLRKLMAEARPTAAADLASATGPVVVRGVVREVYAPLLFEGAPCAAVRLQVDGQKWDPLDERRTVGGIAGGRAVRPFLLADTTGVVRVSPDPLDPRLMGPGERATLEQVQEASLLLDLPAEAEARVRAGSAWATLWRWPVGTTLSVVGLVGRSDGQPLLVKAGPTGLLVSPLEPAAMAREGAGTGAKASLLFWILAALAACVTGGFLLAALNFILRALR